MNRIHKRLHLLCIAAILSSTAILLSCEREKTNSPDEEQNIFIGTWKLRTTIETTPSGTRNHYVYNLDYTLSITNDNRCKLEGTNVVTGSSNAYNTSGTKTFTTNKDILYKLENPKEISFYGASFYTEDGIKLTLKGYLLKNDNTLKTYMYLIQSDTDGSFSDGVWNRFTNDYYEVEFVRR